MISVALLSGGLDSTVAAALAHHERPLAMCITADYGQRAAQREIHAARRIAAVFGCAHRVVRLDFLAEVTHTALVDRSRELPRLDVSQLDDVEGAARESKRAVWVPNRNGVLINVAAAIAEGEGAERVIVGFNREEAATFPDNSNAFLAAATGALGWSTANGVRVESPTVELDKAGIVREGYRIGAPLSYVWSCYRGGEEACLECESCLRLLRALDTNGCRERFLADQRAAT